MNKSELIDAIAASADIPKAAAGRALDAVIESVTGALKAGDSVVLVGFGTFSVTDRPARIGRNPQTGKTLEIAAAKNQVSKLVKPSKKLSTKPLDAFARWVGSVLIQ
ncbi:HU family DNA-binding protein [Pseudomonas amygdali pv. morsprunorum]|nr:HU family DNA-binding protein [Pseudomonas amygdali pv. morsprunorum]